eukprot:s295_g17.t1
MDALRERMESDLDVILAGAWMESDLDVIMVGTWMLCGNGWSLIWTLSWLAHGCSAGMDGDQSVQKLMNDLDLPSDRANLFEVIDADGSGTLHVTELVQGLLKIRGELTKSDTVATLLTAQAIQGMLAAARLQKHMPSAIMGLPMYARESHPHFRLHQKVPSRDSKQLRQVHCGHAGDADVRGVHRCPVSRHLRCRELRFPGLAAASFKLYGVERMRALGKRGAVHGLNKCPEAYTMPTPKRGDCSQAVDMCTLPSTLHQTESQTQLEPARGKRRSRRKRLPAYSRDLVQLSLEVAQAKHTSQNEQANQRIIAQETAMDLQAMD